MSQSYLGIFPGDNTLQTLSYMQQSYQENQSYIAESGNDIKEQDKNAVYIITTVYPKDRSNWEIVLKKWNILRQCPNRDNLYQKIHIVGYRQPKNQRDHLVNAAIPTQPVDNEVDPFYIPLMGRVQQKDKKSIGPIK